MSVVLKVGHVWRAGCIERCTSGSEGGGWTSNTARCSGTGHLPYSGERLLALPPGRWDEAALCDWLSAFIGRGSELDLPLRELPRMYREIGAPRGTTDVVMVTDCKARVPAEVRDAFNAWKASVTARVLTLVVGDSPGDLAAVSDEVFRVQSLDPASDAVGRVLSL